MYAQRNQDRAWKTRVSFAQRLSDNLLRLSQSLPHSFFLFLIPFLQRDSRADGRTLGKASRNSHNIIYAFFVFP